MIDDVRSALRQIRRTPGFACAVVLTLALGVGATTAVLTLADPMLFRPLPYPEPDRLVTARVTGAPFLQIADFMRAEQLHAGFDAVATFWPSVVGSVAGLDDTALAYAVTPGFFETLRLRPAAGRFFLPDEYRVRGDSADVTVITYDLWQTAFGGRLDILQQHLELNGADRRNYRIVGVLAPDFVLPDHTNRPPKFLLPGLHDLAQQANPNRGSNLVARLAAGVSIEAATAELQAIAAGVERDFSQVPRQRTVRLVGLQEALFGRVRTPLLMLLTATACVLVLACVNLAHLFLARLRSRQRELGVRLALGAGAWRVMRLLVMEATVLAALGGVAALILGQWIFDLVIARTPEFSHVYRLLPAGVDWRIAAFAAAFLSGALVVYGVLPALASTRTDIRESLHNESAATRTRGLLRGNRALIFVQTAVAVTLLVIGSLVVRSFVRLAYQPIGFEPHRIRMADIALVDPGGSPEAPERTTAAQRRVYEQLRDGHHFRLTLVDAIPGMHLWGLVGTPGLDEKSWVVNAYPVAGTFHDVFGLTLLRGRFLDDQEAFANAPVAVVDERAASRLWPNRDPIGAPILDRYGVSRTVIGVVATLRTSLLSDSNGSAFLPFGPQSQGLSLAVRADRTPITLQQLRAIVREIEPRAQLRVWPLLPFERTLGQPRFLAALLGTLGLLTIALSAVGIFGVVNHEVVRRTREVGIRMSLGASPASVRRLVMRGALLPATAGVAGGIIASLWWTRTLRSLLFGLQPHDPITFAASALFVIALVALASLGPAWRASRVEPSVTLRAQ